MHILGFYFVLRFCPLKGVEFKKGNFRFLGILLFLTILTECVGNIVGGIAKSLFPFQAGAP
jgi:hypothetical protein